MSAMPRKRRLAVKAWSVAMGQNPPPQSSMFASVTAPKAPLGELVAETPVTPPAGVPRHPQE